MDLLLIGGKVCNVYSSAIWLYSSQNVQWVKIGDMVQSANEVTAVPIQGLSCY